MSSVSMEQVRADRLRNLFATLDIAPFGSLWRVDEAIWKENIRESYRRDNERPNHPGCSLRKYNTTLGPIPILHGTRSMTRDPRRRRECVAVRDVYGKEDTTYFGGLDPVFLEYQMWQGGRITPADKGRLDADEMNKMQALCARRGWTL